MNKQELKNYFSEMGKKGQKALKAKYGTSHYSKMGKASAKKRWGKLDEGDDDEDDDSSSNNPSVDNSTRIP